MPRQSNSTGPSRGRKGSTGAKSSRSSSKGKGESSSRPFKKDSSKSFGKRAGSSENKGRPFNSRAGSGASARPFKKFDDGGAEKGGFRKRSEESFSERKGFKRPDSDSDRPVRSRRDDDSSAERRPRRTDSATSRPFTTRREDDSSAERRPRRTDSATSRPVRNRREDDSSSERRAPRRTDSGSSRPIRNRREDDSSSERRAPRRTDSGSGRPIRSRKDDNSSSERRAPRRADSSTGRSERNRRDDGSKSSYPKKGFSAGARRSDDEKPFRRRKDEGEESSAPRKRFSADSRGDAKRPFKRAGRDDDKKFSPRKEGGSSYGDAKRSSDGERPRTPGKAAALRFDSEKKGKSLKSNRQPAEAYDDAASDQSGKVRLNKFISNSGVCSRREADELIKMGLISVNGTVITELGYKVNLTDEIRNESTVLRAEKPVYVLINKPKGYITTTADPQERKTVMQILGGVIKERIYPIGRLDRNTTGLLLLTNDGDLADKLMHPSYNVKKIYKVELDKPLTKADFQKITEGVRLEEGRAVVDDLAIVSDDNKTIGIELHIGWNRVVRRIFESLDYEVVKLDRSVYAGLDKKDLGRGEWRFLRKEEVVRLKHYK